MTKNKKIIISLISIGVIIMTTVGAYRYFTDRSYNQLTKQVREQIEEAGFNNISGTIKSVEADNLKILAKVPENYSLLSVGETKYIEKEFLLKIVPTSKINLVEATTDGIVFTEINSISGVESGSAFSAIVSENILKNNELTAVELNINNSNL